jgi:DNA-binding IclR family transcriptional regulator
MLADEEVRNEGLTIKYLEEYSGLSRATLFRMLNQMYGGDLVEKQRDGLYTVTMKGLLELGDGTNDEGDEAAA